MPGQGLAETKPEACLVHSNAATGGFGASSDGRLCRVDAGRQWRTRVAVSLQKMEPLLGMLEVTACSACSLVTEGRWDLSALVQDCASKLSTKHTARLCSKVREQTGSKTKHSPG